MADEAAIIVAAARNPVKHVPKASEVWFLACLRLPHVRVRLFQ